MSWIRTSDELPPDDSVRMVCWAGVSVAAGSYCQKERAWFTIKQRQFPAPPTHWMPIPEVAEASAAVDAWRLRKLAERLQGVLYRTDVELLERILERLKEDCCE